eukprot:1429576-Alexandrium_andersonii.AAC.1
MLKPAGADPSIVERPLGLSKLAGLMGGSPSATVDSSELAGMTRGLRRPSMLQQMAVDPGMVKLMADVVGGLRGSTMMKQTGMDPSI